MQSLLDQDELSFLDVTKDEIGDYSQNGLINRMLMICTKKEMKRTNYASNFNDFSICIRKKMLRLAGADNYGMSDSLLSQQEKETSIPEIIDKSKITKAMLKGYDYLEPIMERIAQENKMDMDKYEDLKELAFICVLIIIARSNIEFKFSN